METPTYDLTGNLIAYEQGDLGDVETLELFCHLISSGMAWQLQGSYGRAAKNLIDNGLITEAGQLTEKGRSL